ncbi:MAG TPA: hypothetical protein VH417_20065 [Vicinamibacterales bacterium]|jgi:hypothetical protein
MVSRRLALRGGVLGAIGGVLAGGDADAGPAVAAAAAAQRDRSDEGSDRIAAAIDKLRDELRNEQLFTEIAAIREAQKTFLRVNLKFPDYIDVGSDIWFAVYDWHVRWQQPLTIGRDPINRYTIAVNQTAVVLRPDSVGSYVGIPYDNR